jgi:hypothetical protein
MRLGVDYGTAVTKAVLAVPGRGPIVLEFDGEPVLPSAVLVDPDGALVVGAAAWEQAGQDPGRFVPAPARLVHLTEVPLGNESIPVVSLVAATLSRVAAQAAAVAGGVVDDVVLTVPGGWGPRRRDLLRRAAYQAGWANVAMVPAAVAIGWHLRQHGLLNDREPLVLADLGTGCTATVLRRSPEGFDILAEVHDPHAGGMAIDTAVLSQLTTKAHNAAAAETTPSAANGPPASDWYADLDEARTAKQALRHRSRVLVSLPEPLPAVTLSAQMLAAAAEPVLDRAADTVARAVTAAGLPSGLPVRCLGGSMRLPSASAALTERLAAPVTEIDPVQHAAAHGAATQPATATPDSEPFEVPGRRDAAVPVGAIAVAGLMAVLFLADIRTIDGQPQLVKWGLLAAAALHLTVAVFAFALLLPWLLPGPPPSPRQQAASGGWRLPVLLPATAVTALGLTAVTTVIIAGYWLLPTGPMLAWAVLPVLPVAGAAAAAGLIMRADPGPWGWLRSLRMPVLPLAAGAAGLLVMHLGGEATTLAVPTLLTSPSGGLLYAAAVAGLLATTTLGRVLCAVPVAVLAVILAALDLGEILAAGYAAALAGWWIRHLLTPPSRTGQRPW